MRPSAAVPEAMAGLGLGWVAMGGVAGTLVRVLVVAPPLLALPGPTPLRILALNVAGAALLGSLAAHRSGSPWLERLWPLVATGFLGGATTFSAMIVAAGRLGHDLGLVEPGTARMRPAGLALSLGYLTLSVALGLAAFTLTRRWVAARRVVAP